MQSRATTSGRPHLFAKIIYNPRSSGFRAAILKSICRSTNSMIIHPSFGNIFRPSPTGQECFSQIIAKRWGVSNGAAYTILTTTIPTILKKWKPTTFTPWHKGGRTDADNRQMLCRDCNRRKGKQWYFNKKQAIILPNGYSKWGRIYSLLSHVNMFSWNSKSRLNS